MFTCTRWIKSLLVTLAILLSFSSNAQLKRNSPVITGGDTLFYLADIDSVLLGENRAKLWNFVSDTLLKSENFDAVKLHYKSENGGLAIYYLGKRLQQLFIQDTLSNKASLIQLADKYKSALATAKEFPTKDLSEFYETLKQFGIIMIIVLLSYIIYLGVNKVYLWLVKQLKDGKIFNIKGFQYRNIEILNRDRLIQFISLLLKVARIIVVLVLVYLLIPTVFSFFPHTREIGYKLSSYILDPINAFDRSFFAFVPELILIGILVVAAKYLIKFLGFWSKEISEERLELKGFYADWAIPTFNLIRFLVFMVVLVYILQHLPGSNAPLFLGFLAVLGLTLALAASKPLSNFASGILLTYMRAFKVGDRVKVDEASGVVTNRNLFITRIKTKGNEYITVPNAKMLDSHVINYSSTKNELGLVVYCEFSLNANVDYRDLEEDLIEAALRGDSVIDNPRPWLMISEISNGKVKYKLAAYTQNAGKLERIKSSLYKQVYQTIKAKGLEF